MFILYPYVYTAIQIIITYNKTTNYNIEIDTRVKNSNYLHQFDLY